MLLFHLIKEDCFWIFFGLSRKNKHGSLLEDHEKRKGEMGEWLKPQVC